MKSKISLCCFSLIIVFAFNIYSLNLHGQGNQSFLKAPRVIQHPDIYYRYSAHTRKFTGIPSIAVTNKGRMWATWYAGVTAGEDLNNYVVVATSTDTGRSWKEVFVVDPDEGGPVRAYDPEIWIAPNGVLYFFWAQTINHDGTEAGVWAITTDDPDTDAPELSTPKRIADGVMMCKPTVLSNGEWLLPVSTWLTGKSARVVASTDQGESWHLRGACDVPKADRTFDENMVLERADGSLLMLVRTKYGIGESISKDKGRSWSSLKPSSILHTSSRFFIRKLQSGHLLLVKHGPIGIKTGRSHLMAFISKDNGSSWSRGLLLDARPGVSYPDGQQTANGSIYIIYDYNRTKDQQILLTDFTEYDITSGDCDSSIINVFKNRKVVSNGGK